MYLHHDRELFTDVIIATAEDQKRPIAIVEKDYYVTMILKLLAERAPACVFKGGTSLAKCHHAIDRFSEDIDITFSNTLTQGQRKKLKNNIIAGIRDELGLPIMDWENIRSRRDYNCYIFDYQPIEGYVQQSLVPGVKMEVALGSIAFPTVELPVDSFVYQFLSKENMDIVEEYGLQPFMMTLQSLDRTFADKVFALCDYYMQDRIKGHSRHIYDIYMLLPKIHFTEEYKELVGEIRSHRAEMVICPSAQEGIDVVALLKEIVDNGIYRDDYRKITSYFQNHPLDYETAIGAVKSVIDSGIFDSR